MFLILKTVCQFPSQGSSKSTLTISSVTGYPFLLFSLPQIKDLCIHVHTKPWILLLGFLDLEKINICFKRMFRSNVHITTNKNNNVDINKYDLYFERGLKSHRNELMQVLGICNRAVNNMHFHKFALQHVLFFNLFIFSFPQQLTLEINQQISSSKIKFPFPSL